MTFIHPRFRGRLSRNTFVSWVICSGIGAVMAAPAADPLPASASAPDAGAVTLPGSAMLRSQSQHKMSLGPVAPPTYASTPQRSITEIKSHTQKKAEIEKRRHP